VRMEPYRGAREALTREKLRRMERTASG